MTLKLISKTNFPNYIALSSDVLPNATVARASIIGGTILLSDTDTYKLILPSLKIIPFSYSNDISGTLPEFVSAEIGNIDSSTVVLTLSENIVANDYSLGFTIKINGISELINSATRQSNHAIIYFILDDSVISTDNITIEYNSNRGGISSETGVVYLNDITPQEVQNNVSPP